MHKSGMPFGSKYDHCHYFDANKRSPHEVLLHVSQQYDAKLMGKNDWAYVINEETLQRVLFSDTIAFPEFNVIKCTSTSTLRSLISIFATNM